MRRADVVGSLRPADTVVLRLLGVPVVSALDAWAGLATQVEFRDLVAAGDWLVTTHRAPALVDLPELHAFAGSLRGRHGSPSVRRAASAVRAGAWSVPETHLRLLLAAAGLPAPVLNHPVGTGVHIPDLSWPVWRVAVEYNGVYHEEGGQRRRDLRRAESMVQLGWTTVNVDRDDLYRAPSSVVSRVVQRLRSRGWRE
ncbi:hypothetical protein [Pseudolysinimonas sp.]|uniref:hypothetical protein n=1 Tax=Pseudolysinimonas sp. TaxID=2680009 RepID=UPI003F81F135